jgi:predicted phosphodiesterase
MLFLHLSDIHFRAPQCLTPDTDRDRPYRTRLERDLVRRVAELGPIDAILVGGDIAFQGDPREYEEARKWLLELAKMCGCSKDRIMVVPGNHDVNRKACEDMPTKNVHAMIAQAPEEEREWMLEQQLRDTNTGQALFHGHAAYNDFASKMNCQVYPGRLYWKQDVELGQGAKLRIHGLTSTLLSGRNGKDDPRGQLYLSALQTTLDPAPNVVNMAICHHPFDWLLDGDDVEDKLNARAAFQVFGHKHRQRIAEEKSYIRWSAGAVNPSRSERQFEPSYNIIRLELAGEAADRHIDVESHLYRFQPNPEGFHPLRNSDDKEVFRHSIPFPLEVTPVFADAAVEGAGETAIGAIMLEAAVEMTSTDAEASMGDKRTRHIVDRFWDLDASDRREIALELGLITPAEIQLPEAQRYGIALIRAAERQLIEKLDGMVSEREDN